ncbi:MAG: YkvA family protein [Erysipelotrichaceae bacterium]
MNLKERARKLKKDIPTVFLCLKDSRTPISAKIMALLVVVQALSPIDLIPDFIPVLGYLDDVVLLPFLIYFTIKLIPEDIWKENSEKEIVLDKKWQYAIPIIVIWILVITVVIKLICMKKK